MRPYLNSQHYSRNFPPLGRSRPVPAAGCKKARQEAARRRTAAEGIFRKGRVSLETKTSVGQGRIARQVPSIFYLPLESAKRTGISMSVREGAGRKSDPEARRVRKKITSRRSSPRRSPAPRRPRPFLGPFFRARSFSGSISGTTGRRGGYRYLLRMWN